MRATVLRDGKMVYRDDVPEPKPGPGEVLVAVQACGVCGSDLHFLKHGGRMIQRAGTMMKQLGGLGVDVNRDVFLGHEFSAEVIGAGPGTETRRAGTPVVSMPAVASAKGTQLVTYSNTNGGYAERMLLSAALVLPIRNGFDPKKAALTEPMAVGLHAVNKSNITHSESALVLGCGPVGIAVIAALRNRKVDTIVGADYSPKRRELAVAMGADMAVDPAQESPYDTTTPTVIFDVIGVPGILDDALRRSPHGSRIVVVGVCMEEDALHPFYGSAKEMNVQFVLTYTKGEFAEALRTLYDGEIDVTPMITGYVGLESVSDAFADLAEPERHCKILVTP